MRLAGQVAERRRVVGWWPDRAPDAPLRPPGLSVRYVFPSGRAAIAQSLQAAELPANSVIAVAGQGSECLARVVRRFGCPVDIRELGPSVAVAVVYEPWGWPLTDDAWLELKERFKGRLLLVDRVDSADFFTKRHGRDLPPGSIEVLSLSKLIGIDGGGLARANGSLVGFEPQPASEGMQRLRRRPLGALARAGYRELFKESRHAVHPGALAWLQHNCLTRAAEAERAARQLHLQLLLNSGLAARWPAWMVYAVTNGAGPVWAPLLRGEDVEKRWSAMCTLDQRYGLVSASRLFNWSGNPLRPEYEMCLALPVHGGVSEFDEIVAALE